MDDRTAEEHRVEMAVGALLRWGVLTAAAITAVGGLLLLLGHGREVVTLGSFVGEPSALTTLGGIATAALHGEARAVVQLGVVVLIATPILRVAFTLVAFMHQRDRLYTMVTAVVLGILIFSLFSGHAGG